MIGRKVLQNSNVTGNIQICHTFKKVKYKYVFEITIIKLI
jgi:hypothetical protein